MRSECYFCHVKTIQNLITKFNPKADIAEDFIFKSNELLGQSWNLSNPEIATTINRIAKEKLNVSDLYTHEKITANKTLLSKYSYWRKLIDSHNDPFKKAVQLAVIGNIIDYGAHSLNGDLQDQIKSLLSISITIDKTAELKKAIENANSILYLGDNAGEIFFDKLLIETIKHPNITFATRGYPVINDITLDDAKYIGLDKLCKVISNGFDAPSTLLKYCSEEFIKAYKNADLIISKGQGNFEGLMNENHTNTFFLLIAKCNSIADLIGCSKNDMIVTKLKQKEYAV